MRRSNALERRLPGKRAFVTGGGAGIGRALCLMLAERGWAVAVADVDLAAAEAVAGEVSRRGGRGWARALDVSDSGAFADAAAAFEAAFGGLELLINNAGIGDVHPFESTAPAVLERIVRVNQLGVANGCRAFVPLLRRQGRGHIVNVCSVASFAAPPGMAAYASSKAGALALTEVLFTELRSAGIGVSAAIPFVVNTELFTYDHLSADARSSGALLKRQVGVSPETVARAILRGVAGNRLYIFSPGLARLLFDLKRAFPRLFLVLSDIGARRLAPQTPR